MTNTRTTQQEAKTDQVLLLEKCKKRIKKAIKKEKKQGYGGIDIALDSVRYCIHDDESILKIVHWAKEKYGNDNVEYTIDAYGLSKGCCGHCLSINFGVKQHIYNSDDFCFWG